MLWFSGMVMLRVPHSVLLFVALHILRYSTSSITVASWFRINLLLTLFKLFTLNPFDIETGCGCHWFNFDQTGWFC